MMWMTAPRLQDTAGAAVSDGEMLAIMTEHCAGCHATDPIQAGFTSPPKGIELDTLEKIDLHRDAINRVTVLTHTMPLGNLTGMTDDDRVRVGRWLHARGAGQ
jgi:uncharacterized membrane protein